MSDASMPTQAEAVEALKVAFPDGFLTNGKARQKVPLDQLILECGPLTEEHVTAAENFLSSGTSIEPQRELSQLRHSHHRAAQFVALGLDDFTVARLSNYTPSSIARLHNSPAFNELVAHYAEEVREEWGDFVTAAKDLSLDALGVLRDRMEENPAAISTTALVDIIKTLADRTGNAPVQRSVNVNANVDLGSDLRKARERAAVSQRQALLTGPPE